MIAVDTNIIVRLIVGDDAAQVDRALALASREPFYISFTVLIEVEWVLRSRYGFERDASVAAFRALRDLVDLHFEDADDVAWALERFALAGELADYIHIATARHIGRLATFEKKLGARAGEHSPAFVELVP